MPDDLWTKMLQGLMSILLRLLALFQHVALLSAKQH